MRIDFTFEHLVHQLHGWTNRRRLRDGLIWGPRGFLAGLLTADILATIARSRPFLHNEQIAYGSIILAFTGIIVAIIILVVRRYSLLEQARFADSKFYLKERTATAVEVHHGHIDTTPSLAKLQLSDTLAITRSVDSKTRLPLRLDRRDWLIIILALVLLITAILLPNPQSDILKKRQDFAQTIKEQVEAIEALREEISENPQLAEEERAELLKPITSALEGLDQAELTQEGAVATLSESEADLRELATQYSTESLRQALQNAGEPLAENPISQAIGESLQNGNLAQAGAALAQLADSLTELSPDELTELAQDLAETSSALQGIDDELAQELAEAAQALQNGNVPGAQQALRDVSGTMQQRAQESAAAQQAEAAADQLSQGRQGITQSGEGGQGQGQGSSQGQGQGESSSGGNGQGQGSQTNQGEGTGGPGPGGGHAENVFVPEYVDLSSEEGVDIELPAECRTNPAECGGLLSETPTDFTEEGSSIPYNQVFGDYRNATYEALSDEYIPLGLKDYVREYFSSLEP